jgi:ABC-2 type transport system permease protein
MKARIENYPFFIYLMTAVFPWTYFSSSISAAVDSIVSNRELIKKTYFPRQAIPVSVVLANLINFLPALIVMVLFLFLFRIQFTMLIFLLPIIILLQTIFTIGLALIVSCLQVILRDIKYLVEIGMMAWFYLSPVFYSLALIANISERFFKFYMLNPFVGLFSLYRIVFLKGYVATLPSGVNIFGLTIWTVIVCMIVFFIGLLVFKKYEPRFFDLL